MNKLCVFFDYLFSFLHKGGLSYAQKLKILEDILQEEEQETLTKNN